MPTTARTWPKLGAGTQYAAPRHLLTGARRSPQLPGKLGSSCASGGNLSQITVQKSRQHSGSPQFHRGSLQSFPRNGNQLSGGKPSADMPWECQFQSWLLHSQSLMVCLTEAWACAAHVRDLDGASGFYPDPAFVSIWAVNQQVKLFLSLLLTLPFYKEMP